MKKYFLLLFSFILLITSSQITSHSFSMRSAMVGNWKIYTITRKGRYLNSNDALKQFVGLNIQFKNNGVLVLTKGEGRIQGTWGLQGNIIKMSLFGMNTSKAGVLQVYFQNNKRMLIYQHKDQVRIYLIRQ